MKTVRAFLVGSALGALVGLILAPQRDTIARAQLAEECDRNGRVAAKSQASPAAETAPETQALPLTPARVQGTPMERRYVGNLNTKIFHEATDANLPNEENRAYFATPEEAEAAGYRPAQL